MTKGRPDLIEYSWDERSGIAEFVYEDQRTGELSYHQASQPLKKPEITDETRFEYFANLKFYLDTQPLYD